MQGENIKGVELILQDTCDVDAGGYEQTYINIYKTKLNDMQICYLIFYSEQNTENTLNVYVRKCAILKNIYISSEFSGSNISQKSCNRPIKSWESM